MKTRACALFLASIAGAAFADAQTAPADTAPNKREEQIVLPAFTVDATKDTGYIGSNSLSASRAAISVADIPGSVIVITRQLMEDIGAFDVADAMRYVSGVSDSNLPAQDNLGIRIRGAGPTVATDGFISGGEGTDDLAEIERVEVLKGPSAILFARGGSAGGTINRITKTPLERAQGYFKVQTGLFDANRVEVDSTGPVPGTDKKLLYRAVFAAQDDDAFFENVKTKRYLFAPSVTYRFTPDAHATLKYSYFYNRQTQYVGVPINTADATKTRVEDKLFNVPRERTVNDPNDYQGRFRHRLDLTSGVKLGEHMRSSFNAQYFDKIDVRAYSRPTGNPLVQPDGTVPRSWGRIWTHDYRYRIYNDNVVQLNAGPTANTIIFGFDGLQEGPGLQSNQAFRAIDSANINRPQTAVTVLPAITTPKNPISEQRTGQIYAMDTLKTLEDRLILTFGATRNWVHIDNYTLATATWTKQRTTKDTKQYGIVVRPIPSVSLYYGYNENFDAQFVRLGARQPDGSYVDAGAAPPRLSIADEYGVKFTRDDGKLSWSIAHFDTDLTNRTQVIVGTPFFELQSGGNYTGWESDFFYRPWDNLSLIATYSYTDATDARGSQIETIAPHTFSGLVRYDFTRGALKGLGVSFGGNYQNEYILISSGANLTVEPRTLLDAGLFYTWRKKYKFQVNVSNLADKKYIAGGFLPARVFLGAGRNIRASVTYNW